jgi:hypothetical protein
MKKQVNVKTWLILQNKYGTAVQRCDGAALL